VILAQRLHGSAQLHELNKHTATHIKRM
jgi:hypothetical protein